MCVFIEMMESQGRSLIEDDKLQLTSIEAVRSLELMVDFVNKYDITPKEVVNSRESEIYNSFLNNNGLFLIGWPAFLNEYPKFTINKDLDNHIKIAPIPHFKNGKSASTFGGWNLMISKFSQNIDEAIIFIKYLISDEAQSILYEEGGYLPINNLIYMNGEDEKLLFYKQIMKTGVHRPFLENYTKISDIIVEYLNKAIKKELSVELALKGAEKKIMNENIFIK
jgi:multiple sugar transport system substrate-binding protein